MSSGQMTASELIDALGGNKPVSEMMQVRRSAVSNWRKFGQLPPRLYLKFEDACRARGVKCPRELFEARHESAPACAS